MALNLDLERARRFGNWAPFSSVNDFLRVDPSDPNKTYYDFSNYTIRLIDVPAMMLSPVRFTRENGVGTDGTGWDWRLLPSLVLPGFLFALLFMLMRYVCREPLSRFGVYMGVVTENEVAYKRRLAEGKRGTAALSHKNQRLIFKFQNQLWLAFFYTLSSVFGAVVLHDIGCFQFPLRTEVVVGMLLPHPWNPPMSLVLYYNMGLGFYITETFSLLVLEKNVRRSDFLEYCLHHFMTILLLIGSHVAWEHKFGGYVLFLHDTSDIMLCISKVVHYIVGAEQTREEAYNKKHAMTDGRTYQKSFLYKYILTEWTVNGTVACFLAGFFFFRMYCLPTMTCVGLTMAPLIRHGNMTFWALTFLLPIFLQLLHVYWSVLAIRLVVKVVVFGGERKDIRSGSEADELEQGQVEGEGDADYVPWEEHSPLPLHKARAGKFHSAGAAVSPEPCRAQSSADEVAEVRGSKGVASGEDKPSSKASTPGVTPPKSVGRDGNGAGRGVRGNPGTCASTRRLDSSSSAEESEAVTAAVAKAEAPALHLNGVGEAKKNN